jgi:hypothetical protein
MTERDCNGESRVWFNIVPRYAFPFYIHPSKIMKR